MFCLLFYVMIFLNKRTEETGELILTNNISKHVSPRQVCTFGVKSVINVKNCSLYKR